MSGAVSGAVASSGEWCVDGIVRSFDQAFRVRDEILPKLRTFLLAALPENAKALPLIVYLLTPRRMMWALG